MTKFTYTLIAFLGLGSILCGENVKLLDNGVLELDQWRATLSAFDANWRTLQPASAPQNFEVCETIPGKLIRYRLALPDAAPGTLSLTLKNTEFKGEATFERPSSVHRLCFQSSLPVSQYDEAAFEVDGKRIDFPAEYRQETIFNGQAKRFRLPTRTGEILLEGNFFLRLQDNRKWDGSSYGLRIGFLPNSGQAERTELNFQIQHAKAGTFGESLGSVERPPYVAAAGAEWKAFEYHRSVLPGSALDFSIHLDAPAGKYGPVIVGPNGRFVFRDRPKVPVRFYGANFVGDSQLPNRKQAEELADRMAAFGFNAIRVHHHDNEIYDRSGKETSRINPERMNRLDYLLACFKQRGIYYTTDIYVSRRNIPASELGEIGAIATPREYKALFYVDDTVYADWEKWAEAFLNHVNPHTGLALKDDPALITLSLVNEGNPLSVWNASPRSQKLYRQEFATWEKEHPGSSFNQFLSHLAIKRFHEMKASLQRIGCHALLSDQNFQNNPVLSIDRSHYDFVDNHAYWDHPRFVAKRWQLPISPSQGHALSARPGVPGVLFPTRLFGKGFTVTEFDYVNPNIYRAVGPALMGAYAAFQDWDGLFPFAYSHSLNSVVNPKRTSGFFDIATDPIKAFAQRIGTRIFLTGDITPGSHAFAAIVTEPFKKDLGPKYPDSFSDLGFLARIGTTTVLPAPEKVTALIDIGTGTTAHSKKTPVIKNSNRLIPDLITAGLLPKTCYDAAAGRFSTPDGQLELNRTRQTLRVSAPGGEILAIGPKQKLSGKYLNIDNHDTFAVFALLPVDTVKLENANRITLMHLTNTQATGMTFGNNQLDRLETWGQTPFLAKRGTAGISLRLPPGKWEIHAIDTAGKRIAQLPVSLQTNGLLKFEIDNFQYPEAVFAYELIRQDSK